MSNTTNDNTNNDTPITKKTFESIAEFNLFRKENNYSIEPKVVNKKVRIETTKDGKKVIRFLISKANKNPENNVSRDQRKVYQYIKSKLIKSGSNEISDDVKKLIESLQSDGRDVNEGLGTNRLVPIYLDEDLDRFEDCYRTDGEVRKTTNKKANFIVGTDSVVGLDIDEEFDDDKERSEQLKLLFRFKPYRIAKRNANRIWKKIKAEEKLKSLVVQSIAFGRSCGEVVSDAEENIIGFNKLNSKLLGDVLVNPDSWDMLGVYYYDPLRSKEIFLSTKDIFYLPINDHHISEGSLYHGISDYETLIDASDTKRILLQKNIKEIATALYAGFGWVLFENPDVTTDQMQKVMDTIEAGAWTGTDQSVKIQVEKIAQDSPMLLEIVNEMNLEILRCLDMPSPLGGYENKQNYSNLQQVSEIWKEGTLKPERQWFISTVERQLLDRIFKTELKKQGIEWNKGECLQITPEQAMKWLEPDPMEMQQQQQSVLPNPFQPNTQPTTFETQNPIYNFTYTLNQPDTTNAVDITLPQTTGTITDSKIVPPGLFIQPPQNIEIPAAKLTLEIEEPNFTPFKEKVDAATIMLQNNGLSIRKYDEFLGFPEEVEEAELRTEEQKQQQLQFQQNNPFMLGNNNLGKFNNNDMKQQNKEENNNNNLEQENI